MKNGPVKRYRVNIYRPTYTLDDRGQRVESADTLIARAVPASVEYLNGRELEIARMQFPTASHRVRFYVSVSWDLVPRDYIDWHGKRLDIGYIDFEEGIQVEAVATCGQWVQ